MNIHGDCTTAVGDPRCEENRRGIADSHPPSSSFIHRYGMIGGWLVPSALVLLLPKCSAYLVAYLFMATGIALSLTTISVLQLLLVILCVTSLSCLFIKGRLRAVLSSSAEMETGD